MNPVPPDRASADAASPSPLDETEAERSDWQLAMLRELAELGMELARAIQGRALAQIAASEAAAAPPGGGDGALGFLRANRAVRQTLALRAKLVADRRAGIVAAEQERRQRHKMKVKRSVQRLISNEHSPFKKQDWLDDLKGRIEDLDDTDFGDRPIGEIVARICRDLGIAFDRSRWEAANGVIAGAGDEAGLGEKVEATPRDGTAAAGRSPPSARSKRPAESSSRLAATGSDPP
jgi:hypothetical protein